MTLDFFIYTISGIFAVALGFLFWQVLTLKKRLDLFFKDGEQNWEEFLQGQSQKIQSQEKELRQISSAISKLEKTSQISLQKVGLVRFNPFNDTGSNQSFVFALLDGQDSGFVVTSLYGRDGNRVYAKPIKQGASEYSLSSEEKEAIRRAKDA